MNFDLAPEVESQLFGGLFYISFDISGLKRRVAIILLPFERAKLEQDIFTYIAGKGTMRFVFSKFLENDALSSFVFSEIWH